MSVRVVKNSMSAKQYVVHDHEGAHWILYATTLRHAVEVDGKLVVMSRGVPQLGDPCDCAGTTPEVATRYENVPRPRRGWKSTEGAAP